VVVPALALGIAAGAAAQTRKAAPTAAGARSATPAAARKPPAPDSGASHAPAAPAADPVPSGAGASDAGVVEARTLDGGTRVFKFSELDIEGRLKSPQLVYFLRRVRAEFAAEELGHRSFMREMSETRKEPTF
jgi:hypothetical protein